MIHRGVRALVWERDDGTCQACGSRIVGSDYSLQHRRARGMGGSKRTETDEAENLIVLCGSGTTGCHGWIESHPQQAATRGMRVRQGDDPAAVAVLTYAGTWVFLERDGTKTQAFPPKI